MHLSTPCVTREGCPLHPDCYDRLRRNVSQQIKQPLKRSMTVHMDRKHPKPISICEKQLRESLMQQRPGFICRSSKKGRTLPPGTVPPSGNGGLLGPVRKPVRRKGCGGEATYFNIPVQPWNPMGFAKIPMDEVERMKASRPVSAEELLSEQQQHKEEERQNKEEEERFRSFYHEFDESRRQRELEYQHNIDEEANDNDVEKAAEARRLMVVHKSLQARHGNDVRVQSAMRAIGAAKCSTMWTAQIGERAMKQRLQAEHEILQALKDTEFNESKWGSLPHQEHLAHNKRMSFGNAVRQQINDQCQLRHFAEKRRRDESLQMREAYEEYKRFQAQLAMVKGEQKTRYRNELFHYIQLHLDFKRLLCEQEQRDVLRANKYIIEKEQQSLEQCQQKATRDQANESKRDALFVIQQKIIDAKVNREEMRLMAEQERMERKYRQQERQAVEFRRQQVEELRQCNSEAVAHINKLKSCYFAQRQREMDQLKLERLNYQQQQTLEKQQKLGRKLSLHEGVTAQMEEHELARRSDQKRERVENERARALEEQRQKEIDLVISVKLDELAKKRCLPHNALQSLACRVKYTGPQKLSANKQP